MTKLDPAQLQKTQLALSIHAQIDSMYPTLKDRNLEQYIYAIANRQCDAGMDDAVVIVPGVHENRKTEVENVLKSLQFRKSTQVEIHFRDGQQLAAIYQVKKKNAENN